MSINRSLGENYNLLRATDCDKAQQMLTEHDPDLIVLDMDINNRQGYKFLSCAAELSSAPIIVCSILEATDVNKQGEALKAGATDFISLPPRLNILNLLIEKHIGTQQELEAQGINYKEFNKQRKESALETAPTVLLVDDCESTSHQICEILDDFDVLWYTDINEAEDQLFGDKIDNLELILLDRCFDNHYAGDDLLRKIRNHPRLGSIPVIMLSVTYQANVIGKCIELGANDFITKNLDATNIIERVKYQILLHRLLETERQDTHLPPTSSIL